jgi:hypothetical protein
MGWQISDLTSLNDEVLAPCLSDENSLTDKNLVNTIQRFFVIKLFFLTTIKNLFVRLFYLCNVYRGNFYNDYLNFFNVYNDNFQCLFYIGYFIFALSRVFILKGRLRPHSQTLDYMVIKACPDKNFNLLQNFVNYGRKKF